MSTTLHDEKTKVIMRKIQKALKLAGEATDDEGQNAMLMAQRLMAKHNISMSEINEGNEEKQKNVIEGEGTKYGRLAWWMKNLSVIIANNFRCYVYINKGYGKSKIVFLGLEEDVEICKMVFNFAVESIKYHSTQYVKNNGLTGQRAKTTAIKNGFISGFMKGLQDKFAEQIKKEEWGLILVKDALVVQEYEKMDLKKATASRINMSGGNEAKQAGYQQGKKFEANGRSIGC